MTRCFFFALWFAAVGFQHAACAEEKATYTCRWYLISECGTGHVGGVEFLEEDKQGNIWTTAANCWQSSLWQFDGKTARSADPRSWRRRYQVGKEGNSLWSAACDGHSGDMFFATEQGLLQLSDNLWKLRTEMFIVHGFGPSTFHHRTDTDFDAVPTKLTYADRRGDLWVYAPEIGLFRHTGPHQGNYSHRRIWNEHTTYWPGDGGRTRIIDLLEKEQVSCMHALNEEMLLIGTQKGSLYVLEEKPSGRHAEGTDVTLAKKHTFKAIGIPEGARINALASDGKGHVWAAYGKQNNQGGVACLKGDRWEVYNHANSQLPARPVTAIACLDNDKVWAGIDFHDPTVGGAPEGVSYEKTGLLEFSENGWEHVECEGFRGGFIKVLEAGPHPQEKGPEKETVLYNECYRRINFIKLDRHGDVWVGTQGGLARFTPADIN